MNLDSLIQEGRVHRSIYIDPGIFRDEMTKVFGGTWVYLGHESEIPAPNDFKTVKLGLRPMILTRDHRGEVHALFNRCSHRAATVCQHERGNQKRFTCSYHGWTFGNDGSLVGVPFPGGYGATFRKEDRGLSRPCRVGRYRGFIFATLNPEAPDLLEFLGPATYYLDQFIDRAPDGEIELGQPYRMTYRANWKLVWDNGADGYHPQASHRSIVTMTHQRYGNQRSLDNFGDADPDSGPMYNQELGYGHTFLDQRPGMGPSLWARVRPMPGREAYESVLREKYGGAAEELLEQAPGPGLNLTIFPNVHLIGNQVVVVQPLAVDLTEIAWYPTKLRGAPDAINALRMRIAEDFPNFGETDDFENFERQQLGLSIPEIEWVDTSRGLGLDRAWADERGVKTTPVTDDGPLRSYHREWKRLMALEVELCVC